MTTLKRKHMKYIKSFLLREYTIKILKFFLLFIDRLIVNPPNLDKNAGLLDSQLPGFH